MSDLIPTRDRIMALLSPPSQDVHLTVEDARWIKAEIERLKATIFETARILRELAEEIERLTVANTQLQVWLEDWQQQAKDKDAEIERLQKELAQKTPKGLQDG